MKPRGPLVTLLAGLATAVVLLGLSVNATPKDAGPQRNTAPELSPPASTATAAAPAASPSGPTTSTAPERVRATYVGRTADGRATIALAVRDGRAIAYLCDGGRLEAWLRGTASARGLALTGANNARLSGTYRNGVATGSIAIADRQFDFTVRQAQPPSGLYRAAATVRNAKIIGGWIVLPDGTQVGVVTTDRTPAPAPELDPATGRSTVAGEVVTAAPIDGTTGSGF